MTDTSARTAVDGGDENSEQSPEEARIAALVEALSKEAADYKDKHLRTLAEMENLRRRTERWARDLVTRVRAHAGRAAR